MPDIGYEDIGPDTLFHPRTARGRRWLDRALAGGRNHYGGFVLEDGAGWYESTRERHRDVLIGVMIGDGLRVEPVA